MSVYGELKGWQTSIGSALGFLALMVAALWNFRLNRKRDAQLRHEEMLATAAALYGELLLLREELARLARSVAAVYYVQGRSSHSIRKFDRHFVAEHQLSEPHLYRSLSAKVGLLDPGLVLAITKFHQQYHLARTWLPMLVPDPERPFSYAVSYVLEPACRGVQDLGPALAQLERLLAIGSGSSVPSLGDAEDVLEMDQAP